MQGNNGLDPKFVSPSLSYDVKNQYQQKGIKGVITQFTANIANKAEAKYARISHLFESVKSQGLSKGLSRTNYFNNKGLVNAVYAQANQYEANANNNPQTIAKFEKVCKELKEKSGIDSKKIDTLEKKIAEAKVMGPLNQRTNELLDKNSLPTFKLKEDETEPILDKDFNVVFKKGNEVKGSFYQLSDDPKEAIEEKSVLKSRIKDGEYIVYSNPSENARKEFPYIFIGSKGTEYSIKKDVDIAQQLKTFIASDMDFDDAFKFYFKEGEKNLVPFEDKNYNGMLVKDRSEAERQLSHWQKSGPRDTLEKFFLWKNDDGSVGVLQSVNGISAFRSISPKGKLFSGIEGVLEENKNIAEAHKNSLEEIKEKPPIHEKGVEIEATKKEFLDEFPSVKLVDDRKQFADIKRGQVFMYLPSDSKEGYIRTYFGNREGLPISADPQDEKYYLNFLPSIKENQDKYIKDVDENLLAVKGEFIDRELKQGVAEDREGALKMLQDKNSKFFSHEDFVHVGFIDSEEVTKGKDVIPKFVILTREGGVVREKVFPGDVKSSEVSKFMELQLKDYKDRQSKFMEVVQEGIKELKNNENVKFYQTKEAFDLARVKASSSLEKEISVRVDGEKVIIFKNMPKEELSKIKEIHKNKIESLEEQIKNSKGDLDKLKVLNQELKEIKGQVPRQFIEFEQGRESYASFLQHLINSDKKQEEIAGQKEKELADSVKERPPTAEASVNEILDEPINPRLAKLLSDFTNPDLHQFRAGNREEASKMLNDSESPFVNVAFIENKDGKNQFILLTKSLDKTKEKEFQDNAFIGDRLTSYINGEVIAHKQKIEHNALVESVKKEIEELNNDKIKFFEDAAKFVDAKKSVNAQDILVAVTGKGVVQIYQQDLELNQSKENYFGFLKALIANNNG